MTNVGGTGITGATGIASGLGKRATSANLEKAGQQFEAVFTGMMMKAMRQANLADPLFDSKAIDTFRDMQDQRIVQSMAEHAPIGIGKAMTQFLSQALPTPSAQQIAPDAASQPDINHAGGTAP